MKGIIVDTNVFVAAGFKPRSASALLVEVIRAGRYRLIWNEATRSEAEAVLSRIPHLRWADIADLFSDEGEYKGAVVPEAFPYILDPTDRKFAALGAATGCPVVSSDDDLLAHRQAFSFSILTPRSFVEREGLKPECGENDFTS